MSEIMPRNMTVDEFLAWAEDRPGRHELVDGCVFAMAPERVRHAECKGAVFIALKDAVRRSGVSCSALRDGMMVRIHGTTDFEPDALVYCGPRLAHDTVEVPDPVIVVEVLSPNTRHYDTGAKLIGYFTVPSIQRDLIVDPDRRVIVHHRREGDAVATRILGAGMLRLDPPGLDVAIGDVLGEPSAAS